jgi:hypothetical protein
MPASLEAKLARVFGLGLTGAIVFLALGVLWSPLLWLGMASLIASPLIGAVIAWRDPGLLSGVRQSILAATLGLALAVAIGLLLRR